jgi:hypothetical protein
MSDAIKPSSRARPTRYAQRRLERDVLEIYETLGRTAGGLRYDEFGAVMVELGFLRSAEAHAKKTASAMASAVSGVTGIRVPSSAVSGAAAGADAPPSVAPLPPMTLSPPPAAQTRRRRRRRRRGDRCRAWPFECRRA